MMCLDPPGTRWRAWSEEVRLRSPSFPAKAYQPSVEFDIFLEDSDEDVWAFRRDPSIRRPISEVLVRTASELPVVVPEIQLLYMAKSDEMKNQQDFEGRPPATRESPSEMVTRRSWHRCPRASLDRVIEWPTPAARRVPDRAGGGAENVRVTAPERAIGAPVPPTRCSVLRCR